MNNHVAVLLLTLLLAGCAPHYSLVAPGQVSAQGLTLDLSKPWNKSPFSPGPRVALWTRDGEVLNQLFVIGELGEGESLFKSPSKEVAMPTFAADMLPNELVDLTVTSLKLLYGGELTVTASNLRPQTVSGGMGFRFNLAHYTGDGLYRQGDVLARVDGDRLYMVIFVAAKTHYYDSQLAEIERLFETARITPAKGKG